MHLTEVVNFLIKTDELNTAKKLLDTFSKYACSLEQFDELGMLYEKSKFYNESLQMLNKCYAMSYDPMQKKLIRSNLAKVYNHLNDPDKSLFYSNLNLEMNEKDYESKMEQSFSYYLKGDLWKSYEIQKDLLTQNIPEQVKKRINFNMGSFEMEKGEFKSGLRKMIIGGKEIGLWKPVNSPYKKWNGEHTNKTVLIYAEAGIGDEIINIRFTKELEKRNIKYIWIGYRNDTNELFKSNGYNVKSINEQLDPLEEYVYCEAMTLPILLNLDKESFWQGQYLTAKIDYINKWKKILPEKYLTVKWSGNPYYDQDLHRKVDKDLLLNRLLELNIPIVSLQLDKDQKEENLINVNIKDWDDTLAIQYLSFGNITSCTSTAHSASAINSKCYVLPPICTYYPWLGRPSENRSWWYSKNTKVFVQKEHKSWEKPINNLIEELKRDLNDS